MQTVDLTSPNLNIALLLLLAKKIKVKIEILNMKWKQVFGNQEKTNFKNVFKYVMWNFAKF